MSAPAAPLQPVKQPSGPSAITPEQRYWRSFKSQQLTPSPQSSPVTHISHPNDYTPTSSTINATSDLFAVTAGSRIRIFSTRSRKLVKTISRFGLTDIAHSGEIRPDSQAVLAGGDSGAVQVFRTESRAILKTWNIHKQPVWTTKWNPTSLTSLMSCSDDRTVRLWDLSESEPITAFTGHQDYVRSGAYLPGHSGNILATGSYDQTVRLWDARSNDTSRSIMTFAHANPIEAVLPLPSPSPSHSPSTTLLAASGPTISILDLVAARPLDLLKSHHQKTITSLSLASNGRRVLSASLDGHLKVLDTTSWRVVAGSKYPSPILSLSVVPTGSTREDRHLAVGLQSGLFSLKTRLSGQQKITERERAREMTALVEGNIEAYDARKARKERLAGKPQGIRKRQRGIDDEGDGAMLVVDGRAGGKKKKLRPWDEALRAGRYGKALDLVLASNSSTSQKAGKGAQAGKGQGQGPDTTQVLTLLTALQHRSALRTALSNRSETSLRPLLQWLIRCILDSRYVWLICRVSMLVLELYAEYLGQSHGSSRGGGGSGPGGRDGSDGEEGEDQSGKRGDGSLSLDGLVERLHTRVRELVEGAQVASMTGGMLDCVMAGG